METLELSLWERCLGRLQSELSGSLFNIWIRPLRAEVRSQGAEICLVLLAPNKFVVDWIRQHHLLRINELIEELAPEKMILVQLEVSSSIAPPKKHDDASFQIEPTILNNANTTVATTNDFRSNVNRNFTFDNFVQGSSNQLAWAAARRVAIDPERENNPMLVYGGVGLGKTHLLHAVGNHILEVKPHAKILYLHSERFVADMVRALQNHTMDTFKRFYRSVDALLIDDIQFFAGKDRSQEEFFHTFNALFEGQQQIIMTCDRYPKEIKGIEERLKSRFGWGLTVAVEPPELETRVAILMQKAEQAKIELAYEVAFFIAKRIRSNVRELEGALKRVIANAYFTGKAITVDFVKDALKDLLYLQDKLVTVDNIQKTVAEYYKIKMSDMLSKKRTRSVARPRQMAMAMAKELTNHSLPEIAESFGGRDHTTVLHACRKIKELVETSTDIAEDYKNLLRILTT